jgi:predicted unusual protein kinase regulating ubiquinone biosynthesis (AarF/ABC1/UbiB family)
VRITNRYYRIFCIVWLAARFFVQIAWFQYRVKRGRIKNADERWQRLLRKQAKQYKHFALKFQGVTIKFGQFLSVRADVLPDGFLDELKDLIDRVPSTPRELSMEILKNEWNAEPLQALAELEFQPIASASIADVYQGLLQDGRKVAVKIQRPQIENVIQADIRALRIVVAFMKRLTSWGKYTDLDALNQEFEETITKELDFRLELKHAMQFAEQMKHERKITVPNYIQQFTTKRVLVSEWVDGVPVTDLEFIRKNRLDSSEIATRLVGSFVQQIAKYGFFHADPHPGNLILKEDGTLVFIDFGMVGSIPKDASTHFIELIQSVVLKNYPQAIEALYKLKFVKDLRQKDSLSRIFAESVEMHLNRQWDTMNLETMDDLFAEFRKFVHDQPLQLPAEYAFLGRAISIVSGILSVLEPELDVIEAVQPHVQHLLQSQDTSEGSQMNSRSSSLRLLLRPLTESLQYITKLPNLITMTLETYIEQQKRQDQRESARVVLEHLERRQRYWMWTLVFMIASVMGMYAAWREPLIILATTVAFPLIWKISSLENQMSRVTRNIFGEIIK